jgi:hypothetical protein
MIKFENIEFLKTPNSELMGLMDLLKGVCFNIQLSDMLENII